MSVLDFLNPLGRRPSRPEHHTPLEQIVLQKRLGRILAFTGLSIDDVVNSPIAKNQVRGYFRLAKLIDRRSEIVELEQQWNPLGK